MTKQKLDVPQELKAFRTQLFNVDKNDVNLKQTLNTLLDNHNGDHFGAFAEEYIIARFDVELVRILVCFEEHVEFCNHLQ